MSRDSVKQLCLTLKSDNEVFRLVVPPSNKERVIVAAVDRPRKEVRFRFLAERDVLIKRVPRLATFAPAPEQKEQSDAC
jgi:hypothetical protein